MPPITKKGQAAKNRIAEVRQNVDNGLSAKQARAVVRKLENPSFESKNLPPERTPNYVGFSGNSKGTPVITPSSLEPATAPVVSPTPLPTEQTKLQADLTAQTEDVLAQKVAQEKMTAEAGKTTALQSYLDQLKTNKGLTQLTSEAYAQEGGVNDITPELNAINDQIRREQRSLDLAKRNITERGGGLEMGASAEIGNLERVSLQKQADLSIIQMAVQGRYDSAKEIADRAVSAQFEAQTIANDIAKFDYEENRDLFTTAEQREYDLLFANRTAEIEQAKADKSAIQAFALSALQAGASTAEVQRAMSAKTMDEAIALVGSYLRPKASVVGAPDVVDINGVDSVWNPETGQFEAVNVGGSALSGDQKQQLDQTLAIARELKNPNAIGKGSAVGASAAKFVPFGMSLGLQGSRTAFENKVNTLKANLTLENLGLLKGPMSDKDLAFLQAVGSSLTTNMSEAEFDKELDKVISRLSTAAGYSQQGFQVNRSAINNGSLGLLTQSNIQVAPDGTQVEIID